jgi:hypothetical protein
MAAPNNAKGRPKGTLNKATGTAKENIMAVFNGLGGTSAMKKWAQENQTQFYQIYAKLIPADVKLSGDEAAPIQIVIQKQA